jgi:integrase
MADDIKRLVENIVDAEKYGTDLPPADSKRLDDLPDVTFAKLVAVGLVNPRAKAETVRVTVAAHAEAYLARRSDVKHSTRLVLGHVVRNLTDYFQSTFLADVTAGDCDDFARWLGAGGRSADQVKRKGTGLSPATCGKRLQWCSSIFRDAVRRGLISLNPFDDVKKPGATNTDRQQYVPAETIETLIAAEPDPEWRALLALARYLGVRTPSEPFSLVWSDIDWDRKRIRIPSPKTEVHGKAHRMAPVLPEVMPHLERLFDAAPKGTVYVFSRLRERESAKAATTGLWANLNLRTALLRKLTKAGIAPWPKLWHALRASAQTDLSARFPAHVVAGWLGNTPAVALKHYLMTTDADFAKAASKATQIPTQLALECVGIGGHWTPENEKTPGNPGVLESSVAERGLEPPTRGL